MDFFKTDPKSGTTVVASRTTSPNFAEEEVDVEGEFGTKRDLSPRHVSMIALAGTIGTGLFLGSGKALVHGGPVGAFLGYTLVGSLVGGMMITLGEQTCYSPNIGGFIEMGNQYWGPHMGFAMTGMAIPSELSAIAIMLGFWDGNSSHVGAYIAVFLVVAVLTNLIGVRYYGEVEFWFACIKVATLVGLILFGLIADLGGIPPYHEYIGGRYWREAPFNSSYLNMVPASKASFLGFWAVLTQASFSFGGIEGISVLAGEARRPRKTMRMAVRTVFYRIGGLYVLAILMIGLCIPQTSPLLLDAVALGGNTAASSPFVVICQQTGVKVLPSIINAVVMTSALSSGNENIYATSRTLLALARQDSMPKIFLVTNNAGVPYYGVAAGGLFGLLAFLSLSNGSNQAFNWLSNLSTLGSLVTWITVCLCYTRFHTAMRIQGINRNNLVLKSWFQPYLAWVCVCSFSVILFFNGFANFINGFDYQGFLASYITLPVFALSFFGWKLVKRTHMVPVSQIDLSKGPKKALAGTIYDMDTDTHIGTGSPEKV